MSSAPGRTFGPYEIISPLGAGGMGEVFKARDTRLDRTVALKVSRSEFTDRFQQEARSIAALNHPNIATLYDVGPDYLVMEYVEGETLRTPLPLPRVLQYAAQILQALEAAHRKGIVHRDLKPGNIMVAKSGIKLLDFGLAKRKAAVTASDETAPMTVSMEGMITGTLQYMSPEQLEGKGADERSDIFAFGAVLYEMLTGQKVFRGESAASVISSIMTAEAPSLSALQPDVPPALERIVRRCLAKDPDDRWQSAADIRHALELVDAAPAAAVVQQERRRLGWPWMATAFVAGLLITFAALRFVQPKPPEPWTWRPLTYSGNVAGPSLSPDGKQVAFRWGGDRNNEPGLYVQMVSGGNPLLLRDVHSLIGKPAWSPDGGRLALMHRDGLYTVPALGGSMRRIAAVPAEHIQGDVAWAPGGSFFVAAADSGLVAIAGEGSKVQPFTQAPSGSYDHSPAISPDNRMVAFVRHTSAFNSQLYVAAVASNGSAAEKPKQITSGVWDIGNVDWYADGKDLIFEGSRGSINPTLWRISRSGGQPVRLNVPGFISRAPSIARQTGSLAYVSFEDESKIFKLDLRTRDAQPQPIVEAIGAHRDLAVSLDGSHIAFVAGRTGSNEVWIANADGSNQTQLTSFNGPAVGSPRWSPDGKSITFDGYASGSSDIYVVAADGGKPQQLTTEPSNEIRPSWSHDGKWVYFGSDLGGRDQIWKIPSAGGAAVRVTDGYNAVETPDGQWLYVLNADDRKIYRMRPDGSGATQVASGAVAPNTWMIGGSHLFVLDPQGHALWKAAFGDASHDKAYQFSAADQPEGSGLCIAVPSDESYLIFRRTTRTARTLILIDNFR